MKDFTEVVEAIYKEDSRYDRAAYVFVRQALDHTIGRMQKQKIKRKGNHVSGQELLEGIRTFAIDQYGPLTYTVLQHWGITKCEHFGDIVFNLVEYGVLGKTEQDSKSDFKDGYCFNEAFLEPFEPMANLTPEQRLRQMRKNGSDN